MMGGPIMSEFVLAKDVDAFLLGLKEKGYKLISTEYLDSRVAKISYQVFHPDLAD